MRSPETSGEDVQLSKPRVKSIDTMAKGLQRAL
jgi:hypothetical protein